MARPHFASRFALGIGAVAAVTTVLPQTANAGGYDTPILYSARHMGMAGTAIGYVNDPSAMFHNPAGLSGIHGLELLGDISPLYGSITSSPGSPDLKGSDGNYPSRTTEPAVSPLFMLGAGYRIAEAVSVGLGFYPVAAAAGEYRGKDLLGMETIDKTRLVFLEFSPALSVNLLRNLSVGLGYRVTLATLERVKGNINDPREFNFTVSGVDAAGFRAGLQWQVSDNLSVGAVYRHKVDPTLKGDNVYAYKPLVNGETTFVLPSKAGIGFSGKFDRLHPALDFEYGFYSQNTTTTLSGVDPTTGKVEQVTNYFMWQNAVTARIGLEYLLGNESQIPVRVGYIFDGKVGNKMYPTAFGTPPAPSNSFTVGAGYRGEKWQANIAGAYRFASAVVTPADLMGAQPCASCSQPGPDYNLKILGFYLDFSYRFDVAPLFGSAAAATPAPTPTPAQPATPASAPEPVPAPATPTTSPAPSTGPTTSPAPATGATPATSPAPATSPTPAKP
jgi:long-subunit fatty acid transport protein